MFVAAGSIAKPHSSPLIFTQRKACYSANVRRYILEPQPVKLTSYVPCMFLTLAKLVDEETVLGRVVCFDWGVVELVDRDVN